MAFFFSCPTDGTVKFHHATGTKRRFSIQAFRFLSNTITIYVHCYVFLCHNQSTVSRCQSGCLGNKIRVRRNLGNISEVSRDDTAHSKDYPLGIGPIILQKDKPTNTKPTDTGKEQICAFFVPCCFAFFDLLFISVIHVKTDFEIP